MKGSPFFLFYSKMAQENLKILVWSRTGFFYISFYHLVFQKKPCLNIVCNRLTDNDQFKKYGIGLTDMQGGLVSLLGDCTQLILQKWMLTQLVFMVNQINVCCQSMFEVSFMWKEDSTINTS